VLAASQALQATAAAAHAAAVDASLWQALRAKRPAWLQAWLGRGGPSGHDAVWALRWNAFDAAADGNSNGGNSSGNINGNSSGGNSSGNGNGGSSSGNGNGFGSGNGGNGNGGGNGYGVGSRPSRPGSRLGSRREARGGGAGGGAAAEIDPLWMLGAGYEQWCGLPEATWPQGPLWRNADKDRLGAPQRTYEWLLGWKLAHARCRPSSERPEKRALRVTQIKTKIREGAGKNARK
jgi:hypothetical protein